MLYLHCNINTIKMKKKFLESTSITVRDPKTGLDVKTDVIKIHVVTVEDFDRFYMVYFNMLKTFYEIKYLKDVMLLFKLCEMANFNTGKISLGADDRNDLCAFINVQNSHLSSGLKRLTELGLIFGKKGSYVINEGAFWRGDNVVRGLMLKDRGLDFIIRFKNPDLILAEEKKKEAKVKKPAPVISLPEGDEDAVPKHNQNEKE